LLAIAAAICADPSVSADELPKDVDGFTQAMARRFADALPGFSVKVTGPLTLDAAKGADLGHQLNLDAAWSYCGREPQGCEAYAADFLAHMSAIVAAPVPKIERAALRAVVRSQGYVDTLQRMAAKQPEIRGVVRPIADGLWLVCVVDMPDGVQPLQWKELRELGLTEDEAFALALKQLAASLKPLKDDTQVFNDTGLTYATGDFYEASRMALHDDWKPLSDAYGGHLVVGVPSTDVLIYGNGTGNGDVVALRAFTEMAVEHAPKPLSAALYHWTPEGWELLKPD
jgi:hypothetical protein